MGEETAPRGSGYDGLMKVAVPPPFAAPALWRDVLRPKEYGSWSLALEPLVLGLLAAPSFAGAGLATALVAGFFARRPFRMLFQERRDERRAAAWQALALCAFIGLLAFSGALAVGGVAWLPWLGPVGLAGAAFAWCDARGAGREEAAEMSGAAAFAFTPAAIAILGGWNSSASATLACLMLGRSVPSVACVRAFLRGKKSGVWRSGPALIGAVVAALGAIAVAWYGLAPWFGAVALTGFAGRALWLLVLARPSWRARSVGIMELLLGSVFVIGLALAWRR